MEQMNAIAGEIGDLLLDAVNNENLVKLKEIRWAIGNDKILRKICENCEVLRRAAEMGELNICKFLIEAIQVSDSKDTPLVLAAKGGYVEVVKYFLGQGAEANTMCADGFTALHYAAMKGEHDLIDLLIDNRANIEAFCVDGTPLQCAASKNQLDVVIQLLDKGAKPYSRFWNSPLVSPMKCNSHPCFRRLLEAGILENNDHKELGTCPLSIAAQKEDTSFLQSLLEAGVDPKLPMKPIEEAARARNRLGVEILFPKIRALPEWTIDGFMKYFDPGQAEIAVGNNWPSFAILFPACSALATAVGLVISFLCYFEIWDQKVGVITTSLFSLPVSVAMSIVFFMRYRYVNRKWMLQLAIAIFFYLAAIGEIFGYHDITKSHFVYNVVSWCVCFICIGKDCFDLFNHFKSRKTPKQQLQDSVAIILDT